MNGLDRYSYQHECLRIVDSVGMDRFWAGYSSLRAAIDDILCASLHSGRNSTVLHTNLSACDHVISQAKERVKPCGVFGKPKVANPLHTRYRLACCRSTCLMRDL